MLNRFAAASQRRRHPRQEEGQNQSEEEAKEDRTRAYQQQCVLLDARVMPPSTCFKFSASGAFPFLSYFIMASSRGSPFSCHNVFVLLLNSSRVASARALLLYTRRLLAWQTCRCSSEFAFGRVMFKRYLYLLRPSFT